MKTIKTKQGIGIATAAVALAAMPAVLAAPWGNNPLSSALETVGALFNFSSLANNSFAVQGITHFALFMIVFAICHYGLMIVFKGATNPQGKKTAAIVSFAMAMISTIAVNPVIGDANAGLVQGVVASFLMLFVFIGGGIYAIIGIKPTQGNENMSWFFHLLGILLILLLMQVFEIWVRYSGFAVR